MTTQSTVSAESTKFEFPSSAHDDIDLQLDSLEIYDEADIFCIDDQQIKHSDDDDDADDFAKKLLLSPRWHDKNEPVRDFRELSTHEYYAKSREILNHVSYSTNIHIHKSKKQQQQEEEEPICHQHPFEIFLRDMDKYGNDKLAFSDHDDSDRLSLSSVSTLGPSPSVISPESDSMNISDISNQSGYEAPTALTLNAYQLQIDNSLLLAEIDRLKKILKEKDSDMHVLSESVNEKNVIIEELKT